MPDTEKETAPAEADGKAGQDPEAGTAAEAAADPPDAAEMTAGEDSPDSEEKQDDEEERLLDIFREEQAEVEGGVGLLEKFLEDLTMHQIASGAEELLEEFRAL